MSKEKEAAEMKKNSGLLSPDEVKFYQQAGEIFGRVHELLPSGRLKMEVFLEPGKMRWMSYTWDDWISGKPWSGSFIVLPDTLRTVSSIEQFSREMFRELSRMYEWHGGKCGGDSVLKTES
jgi:hypothetical protein